jgi:hypothetical protein
MRLQHLSCQFLYFCTSKASKLSTRDSALKALKPAVRVERLSIDGKRAKLRHLVAV